MALLGPRHRGRADARPGARRLADRQLQLALGLLHQHAGRHRVARHDEAVHLRPALHRRAETRKVDYWGIGMLAVGIGALQIVLDKGQEEDWFSSHFITRAGRPRGGRRWSRFIIRELHDRAPGRGPARLQGPHLRRRRLPDDRGRLRALRQPGAAADLAADAARLSGAAGRDRHGAARHRLVHRHAAGRHADRHGSMPRKLLAPGS